MSWQSNDPGNAGMPKDIMARPVPMQVPALPLQPSCYPLSPHLHVQDSSTLEGHCQICDSLWAILESEKKKDLYLNLRAQIPI